MLLVDRTKEDLITLYDTVYCILSKMQKFFYPFQSSADSCVLKMNNMPFDVFS